MSGLISPKTENDSFVRAGMDGKDNRYCLSLCREKVCNPRVNILSRWISLIERYGRSIDHILRFMQGWFEKSDEKREWKEFSFPKCWFDISTNLSRGLHVSFRVFPTFSYSLTNKSWKLNCAKWMLVLGDWNLISFYYGNKKYLYWTISNFSEIKYSYFVNTMSISYAI